ncbi:hypothetical protein JVT61DRAFT_1573 [Boletus reticuloceps]|uniref:Integral membrane protein n=1 Tax=Boletus reticuloceps TaxID=495285 RepID=A0A8I2YSK8_9AGAM|nr:hypothetical protein JVT61DRAFT_1573 [Boletus reticuloceps]
MMTSHLWTLNQQVAVSILYILAIITGTFRAFYRWYISRFWWEDVWATFALLLDIICFANVWIPQPRGVSVPDALIDGAVASSWMAAIALTCGLCMITAIIRITSHRVQFRHFAYATAVAFGMMWIAILIQKLYIGVARSCFMSQHVATSQLATDVISDVLLMALPLFSLRGVNIEHSQRVLLVSSFASSIGITIISIVHSVLFFLPSYTAISIILAHVKVRAPSTISICLLTSL